MGRVGGVLLARRQLTLQIGDLLFLFRQGLVFVPKGLVLVPDLFLRFLYLPLEALVLTTQRLTFSLRIPELSP